MRATEIVQMARGQGRQSAWRLLCLLAISLAAQVSTAQRYPVLLVPNSPRQIFTMMQDSQSRLWLGTIDNVYSFDGARFYSLRPYGFPRETPNSMADDAEGGIWIGTQGTDAGGGSGRGGLYRYQSGQIQKLLASDVLSVVSVAPGLMLVAVGTEAQGRPTYGDLYRFRKVASQWQGELLRKSFANHMTMDRRGTVLFPCPGGWCELSGEQALQPLGSGSTVSFTAHAGSPVVERVLRDRFDCVWFRAEASASYQCPGMRKTEPISLDISGYDSSAHLQEAPDGSIFMLVNLALGRPGAFHIARARNGIPEMGAAMISQDGTIWIGGTDGLYRFAYPFRLEYWTKADGLTNAGALLRTEGQTFVTSDSVLKLGPDRRTWKPITGQDRLGLLGRLAPGPSKTFFVSATQGVAQLNFEGKLLAKSPPLNFSTATGPSLTLARTRQGTLWLAGPRRANLVVRDGNRLKLVPTDLPQVAVNNIHYDANGDRLWACIGNDIYFGKPGAWQTIGKAQGLADAECSRIAVSPEGDVWMSYRTPGYALIKDASVPGLHVKNYLQDANHVIANNGTYAFAFDHRGWLWRGSTELYVATSRQAQAGLWLRLGEQDGIPWSGPGEGDFDSDSDGSVWLADGGRVTHFSPPADFLTHFPVPPVFVSSFSVSNGAPTLAEAFLSTSHNSDVVVHVGSLQFDRRSALHLRYRLQPEQSMWKETDSLDVDVGRLHWGTHSFEVQARLATSPWSSTASHSFTILKPFWLTWPFLLGVAVVSAAGATAGVSLQKKNKLRRLTILPDLSSLRMRVLSPEVCALDGELLDGRFEIGRVLARGGFATVVESRDMRQNGSRCAVKIFRQEWADEEWTTKRFRQEVLALEQINHPNVVRIYGHGTTPTGTPYLAMEFIEGRTLREVLSGRSLPMLTVASYLRQMGSALNEIHKHGICHRDLKPENLMVRANVPRDQEIVLIDFSIAIVKDPDETLHGLSRAAGTLHYMAPEQGIGYADPSTDIYSLAKILIEMLTGKRLSELLPDASIDLPLRVKELLASLSLGLSDTSIALIARSLEFHPLHRPSDVTEFAATVAADLERQSNNDPGVAAD